MRKTHKSPENNFCQCAKLINLQKNDFCQRAKLINLEKMTFVNVQNSQISRKCLLSTRKTYKSPEK